MLTRDMSGYHQFKDESGDLYGSFEVFFHDGADAEEADDREPSGPGWYWVACFPGCLPDGEPIGPFNSSAAAFRDARST